MSELQKVTIELPETVTVSCPLKSFQQRYVKRGCLACEYHKGFAMLTDAEEMPVKDRVTGKEIGMRLIQWHEKYMVRCAYPMTRRCANIAIVED